MVDALILLYWLSRTACRAFICGLLFFKSVYLHWLPISESEREFALCIPCDFLSTRTSDVILKQQIVLKWPSNSHQYLFNFLRKHCIVFLDLFLELNIQIFNYTRVVYMSCFFIICIKCCHTRSYYWSNRTLKRKESLILPCCRLTHFSLLFEELRAIKLPNVT